MFSGEFAYTGTRRVMIRDDGLVAAAVLRRFRQQFFPHLAPAAEPAGVPAAAPSEAAAAADAAAVAAASGPVNEVEDLQKLAGFSLAERGVDADRVAMAQTPGDLKAYWAKKYVPHTPETHFLANSS
jgi:hypothetical protein